MLPIEITSDFVLQGCSAGALSTFAWTDYVQNYTRTKNPQINYWSLADSAFYVDYISLKTGLYEYKVQMQALYSTVNDPAVPFPQAGCVGYYDKEAYKCFLTEYMFPFIKSPMFIIQSGYDQFQIPNVLQSKCTALSRCSADDLKDIHTYHKYQQKRIRELMVQNGDNKAVWSPSCPFHCNFYRDNSKVSQLMQAPMNSGYTLERALRMFTQGIKDDKYKWVWLDTAIWPENTLCAFLNEPDAPDPTPSAYCQ